MKTSLFVKFALFTLIVAIVAAAWPSSALAAGSYDDPQPGKGNDRVQRLEKRLEVAFARIQLIFQRQEDGLARVDEIIARTEALLDLAAKKGLDASAVAKALSDLKTALPAAQSAHNQAGAILAAHNGFDDQGKVTYAAAAGETLKATAEALKAYRATLDSSGRALREAVRAFLEANRGSFKPGDLP